jgi:NAD-dependent SIR2 family protein deacetylase
MLFDRAEVLLVIGSSLTVFSGYRFVRRAAERGVPVGILNRGPTRGDDYAAVRLDARAGLALPALARALAWPRSREIVGSV